MRSRRKLFLLLGTPLAALTVAGVAFAVWSWMQSTSQFEGKTGSTPTVLLAAPTAGDFTSIAYVPCTPGGSCDVVGEATNPTSSPITIVSWQSTAANSYTAPTGCAASNFGGPAEGTSLVTLATPIVIPASASNYVVDLPAGLSLNAGAPTSCENQIVQESGSGEIQLNLALGN